MHRTHWLDHVINFFSVILGVTLAFGINSWASSSEQDKEIRLFTDAILGEVREDIDVYESYQIPFNEQITGKVTRAIALLEEDETSDSLSLYLMEITNVNNYYPPNVTLKSMLSSGKIDLIDDFELRKQLFDYDLTSNEAKAKGTLQVDFLLDRIIPFFLENLSSEGEVSLREGKKAQLTLLLSIYQGLIVGKVEEYKNVVEYAKEIEERLAMRK